METGFPGISLVSGCPPFRTPVQGRRQNRPCGGRSEAGKRRAVHAWREKTFPGVGKLFQTGIYFRAYVRRSGDSGREPFQVALHPPALQHPGRSIKYYIGYIIGSAIPIGVCQFSFDEDKQKENVERVKGWNIKK